MHLLHHRTKRHRGVKEDDFSHCFHRKEKLWEDKSFFSKGGTQGPRAEEKREWFRTVANHAIDEVESQGKSLSLRRM